MFPLEFCGEVNGQETRAASEIEQNDYFQLD